MRVKKPEMHTIELLTLGLTIPGVMLSILVLHHWYKNAIQAFFTKNRDSADWMLIGVFVAFLGAVPDNIWWGVYWTLQSMSDPNAPWWQANGIFVNIPFRQIALLVAGYCHLRAAYIAMSRSVLSLNIITMIAFFVGIASMFIMELTH